MRIVIGIQRAVLSTVSRRTVSLSNGRAVSVVGNSPWTQLLCQWRPWPIVEFLLTDHCKPAKCTAFTINNVGRILVSIIVSEKAASWCCTNAQLLLNGSIATLLQSRGIILHHSHSLLSRQNAQISFDKQSVHRITWPTGYRQTSTWECQFWGLFRTPATADLPRLTSFPSLY